MFGLFKKGKLSYEKKVESIAAELFAQIEKARDEAKAGGIVSEKVFNDRLNSMFVAGYLIGYVDQYIGALFADNSQKKENAEKIFELMFPGVGSDFVKSKLMERQQANSLEQGSPAYLTQMQRAKIFDKGMIIAQEEVDEIKENESYQPQRLKEYLLLGQS